MGRPPGVPAEFDVFTVVLLITPDDAPIFTDAELDELQRQHLAYGLWLHEQGYTVTHGPLVQQTDTALRGMAIYTVGRDEAIELARADPSVRAGRLRAEVARWWSSAGVIDFPGHDGPVGRRLPFEALEMT